MVYPHQLHPKILIIRLSTTFPRTLGPSYFCRIGTRSYKYLPLTRDFHEVKGPERSTPDLGKLVLAHPHQWVVERIAREDIVGLDPFYLLTRIDAHRRPCYYIMGRGFPFDVLYMAYHG